MIPQRWKSAFLRVAGRRSALALSVRIVRHGKGQPATRLSVEIRDMPVFDHRHRQVGVIPAPSKAVVGFRFTPASWMNRCMKAPIRWLQPEVGDEVEHVIATTDLQRIPLVNGDNEILGIVVVKPADLHQVESSIHPHYCHPQAKEPGHA